MQPTNPNDNTNFFFTRMQRQGQASDQDQRVPTLAPVNLAAPTPWYPRPRNFRVIFPLGHGHDVADGGEQEVPTLNAIPRPLRSSFNDFDDDQQVPRS